MGTMNPMLGFADASTGRSLAEGLSRVSDVMSRAMGSAVPAVQELVVRAEGYRGKMVRPTMVLLSGLACRTAQRGSLASVGACEHLLDAVEPMASSLASPVSDTLSGSLSEPVPTDDAESIAESADPLTARHHAIGAVIEMIHLATLVHDDVLDEAELRRGSPTIAQLRGNEAAVMLGDYLISRAFELCASIGDASITHRVGQIASRVCEGEIMQLSHRDDLLLDEPTYYDIIERKTACLIGVAAELGARSSGGSEQAQQAAYFYGQQVGIAFQIQDDLLDLIGQEGVVGKTLGKDLDKGKLTLPMIHHIASLPAADRGRFVARLQEGVFRHDREALVDALRSTDSIEYARRCALERIERAKAALPALPGSPARAELALLADAVLTRSR